MSTSFSLAGKRAVITGASRGIGAAVAKLLAISGADVCLGYRSHRSGAEAAAALCQEEGVRAVVHGSDISTAAGASSLMSFALSELGAPDIVIHSAGIWPAVEQPVAELDDVRWGSTMRQNVDAMFFVSRAAVGTMMANPRDDRGGRRIVLISSTAGQRGEALHADYAASKGAMIAFVKSLAVEVASEGITVNAVAPGWVDTEMCAIPFRDGGKARIAQGIPVGRVASAEDIAFPTVCLCFEGSRHITGEIVNVNGGSVLCG